MAGTIKTVTPIDGSVYVERALAGGAEIAAALAAAEASPLPDPAEVTARVYAN